MKLKRKYKIYTNMKLKRKCKIYTNMKVRITYGFNGTEIIFNNEIDINNNTILDLYNNIRDNTHIYNISDLIINNYYSWKYPEYYYDKKQPKIFTILDKNYNKEYINVTLILGSYIPYIINIIQDYIFNLGCYHIFYNEDSKICYEKKKKSIENIENEFIESISMLNDKCISIDDYEEIKLYITKLYELTIKNTFLLNEIEKYLVTN